jgi:glycosyltransferase involved in cell wall biosynthesis
MGGRQASSEPFSIICLSSQEWASDLPTNRQQIMRRAAERGHRVLFVETGSFLGVLLARLLVRRGRASLARRLFASEAVAPRVQARRAVNLLPWRTRYRTASVLNCRLTASAVRLLARRLPRPLVLWVYDPLAAWLIGACGETLAVYDCVDDYVEQAGPDPRRRALASAADERASQRAALVFATTPSLYERKRRLNPRTYLVPNAGDTALFQRAGDRGMAAPEVARLSPPVLGFAGNLTAAKVDFALLEEVARARPAWTLLLVGPAQRDCRRQLQRLVGLPNVRWVGAKLHRELPSYVAAFDVALIPYRSTAYTQSCFPLKLYEYLAAGKPVVASGLPELRGMEPDVVVVEGARAFCQAVASALSDTGAQARARRLALAATNTWEGRTRRLLQLVSEVLYQSSCEGKAGPAS